MSRFGLVLAVIASWPPRMRQVPLGTRALGPQALWARLCEPHALSSPTRLFGRGLTSLSSVGVILGH